MRFNKPQISEHPNEYYSICPFCNTEQGLIRHVTGEGLCLPNDGDISICFTCGGASVFDRSAKGNCRLPTAEENISIAKSEYITEIIRKIKLIKGLK